MLATEKQVSFLSRLAAERQAADRLSLADAKAFGIRYGVCCVCGLTLKDAKSVAAGIGPVCAGRLA